MKSRKATKYSLIISIAAVIINFLTYYTYPKIFHFAEVSIPQSVGFVIFESLAHAFAIFIISFVVLRKARN